MVREHLQSLVCDPPEDESRPQVYSGPALHDDCAYGNLISQFLESGIVDLGLEQDVEGYCGIIFMWRAAQKKLRIIIDARRSNQRFVTPPRTPLARGSAVAQVWVDGGGELFLSVSDIRDLFYRIKMPIESASSSASEG